MPVVSQISGQKGPEIWGTRVDLLGKRGEGVREEKDGGWWGGRSVVSHISGQKRPEIWGTRVDFLGKRENGVTRKKG